MRRLRILIADDHVLMRCGIQHILHSRPGWRVVGEATNGCEAVEKAVELRPDVAVLDISMPELDGIEAARQIRESLPYTKIVMLTMNESDYMIRRALDAGANGYLLKSDVVDSLPRTVDAVVKGKRFLTPKVVDIVLEGFLSRKVQDPGPEGKDTQTTPRETEIIRLLVAGKTNKEIAALLRITVRTVETHRSRLMAKLGVHSLAELIRYAMQHGIATV